MNGDLFHLPDQSRRDGIRNPVVCPVPVGADEIDRRARDAANDHYNTTRDRSGDRALLPLKWEQLGDTERDRWRKIVRSKR